MIDLTAEGFKEHYVGDYLVTWVSEELSLDEWKRVVLYCYPSSDFEFEFGHTVVTAPNCVYHTDLKIGTISLRK